MWQPSAEDVKSLQGQLDFLGQYEFAREASKKFRKLLSEEPFIAALGCVTGCQAVQCAAAGLKSIYLSGWQTAADNNDSHQMYPDMGLYHSSSVPTVIRKINNALRRSAQVDRSRDWLCPIVADAEHGFGGPLKTYELAKEMIAEGVAGIHLENQASERRCGHLGGKILVPTSEWINKLKAIRLAAEVCGVDTVIIARTDAKSAQYINSDADERDRCYVQHRNDDGLYSIASGVGMAIMNGLAAAPYADMLWMEDSEPSIENAKSFADAIHKKYPGKMLALNCSPSFNWAKMKVDEQEKFQTTLADIGYKYLFVTLAGFHALNLSMFQLADSYREAGIAAYGFLQADEKWHNEQFGYAALKHQTFVGTGYFDQVSQIISGSGSALKESTEAVQF